MLAGLTIHNFLLIGLLASLFIIAFKALAPRTGIRGLQAIAQNL
jgi:hypothetical protein